MAKKIATERRSESAKWESKVIGPTDFTTDDIKLRPPGSFEKGKKPVEDEMDRSFNLLE